MAVTDLELRTTFSPNDEQTHFYFDTPGADPAVSVNGIRIVWTDADNDDPYDVEYSKDGGSNWAAVATGVTNKYYVWNLTLAQFTDIFGVDNTNATVQMRVTDVDDEVLATTNHTFCKVSIDAVKPNKLTTDIDDNGVHESPMSYYDAFNIIWDELYASDTDGIDIYILEDTNEYLIYENIPMSQFNAVWSMAHYELADTTVIPAPTSPNNLLYNVSIRGTSAGNHQTNRYTTTAFNVTMADKAEINNAVERSTVPPERTETFTRIAGEKGRRVDEMITIGQIEGSDTVTIIQRDDKGRRVGVDGRAASFTGYPDTGALAVDPEDPKKANNLVLYINEANLQLRKARSKQGIFVPETPVTEWTADAYHYGSMFSYTIIHNWELGDPTHELYVAGQNMNSFHLEIRNIKDADPYDSTQPLQDTHVQFEAINDQQIRCYVVKKGGAYQPALTKDVVDAVDPMSDYVFEYVLIERIP